MSARKLQHTDGYVFLTRRGQSIDKHLDREWKMAGQRAGVRHRPSYHLRHTFASLCLNQGCDPAWLAHILGHSSVQTTFRHHARYINNVSRQNEKVMADFLAKGAQKGDHLQLTKIPDAGKLDCIGVSNVININGGGGERVLGTIWRLKLDNASSTPAVVFRLFSLALSCT